MELLQQGTAIEDKYEIRAIIGSGGMGVVYEAFQPGLDRSVALKMLTGMTLPNEEEFQRFEREGLILSKLVHKNIVRFYAYGRYLTMPYIVMERLQGKNLQDLLFCGRGLPDNQTLDIFEQVCSGLEHAHAQGIFHRDIKPSNIVLEPGTADDTIVKLIDFGLAKLNSEWQVQKLTQTGMAIGSVVYMSPEQCVGQPSGAEGDIYSLGCLLFHMITGEPPFHGEQTVTVMFQHLNQPVQECPGWDQLSEPVQDIVAKAMQKEPANRYRSITGLISDLRDLRRSAAPLTVPVKERSKKAIPVASKFSPRFLLATTVICVAILGALMVWGWSPDKEKSDPEQAIFHASDLGQLVQVLGPPLRDPVFIRELEYAVANAEKDPTANQDNLLRAYTRLADYGVFTRDSHKVKAIIEKSYRIGRPGSRSADEFVMGAVDYFEACSRLDDFRGAEDVLTKAVKTGSSGFVAPGILARVKLLLARLYQRNGDSAKAKNLFIEQSDELGYLENAEISAGMALAAEFGNPTGVLGKKVDEPLEAPDLLGDAETTLSYEQALNNIKELSKTHTWNSIEPEELPALSASLKALNPIKNQDQFEVLSGFEMMMTHFWQRHNILAAAEAGRLGLERCPTPYGKAKNKYIDLAVGYRGFALELGNPGKSREYLEIALSRAPRFVSVVQKGPLTPSRLRLLIADDCLRSNEITRARNLFLESAPNLFTLNSPVDIASAFELAYRFGVPPNLQSGRAAYFTGPPRRYKPPVPKHVP